MDREELIDQLVRYKQLARIHKEIAEKSESTIRILERRITYLEKELEELRKTPPSPKEQ